MEMPHISESPDECMIVYKEGSPAHYVLTIKSYSLLSKTMEKYVTNDFEAGGCKWKLILYPKGNKRDNIEDHISLYISVGGSNELSLSWEINAVFRFYLFDQITNKYFTMQGRVTRLCAMKPVWGIAEFMSLEEMFQPSSGYLVDDTCVFGVEVFVTKSEIQGESLILGNYLSRKHEWKICKFSSVTEYTESETFLSGDVPWKIGVFPNGNVNNRGKFISMFLYLGDSSIFTRQKRAGLFTEFSLCIKSSKADSDIQNSTKVWFNDTTRNWGWPSFLSQSSVKEYIVDDCLTVEAEVKVLGKVKEMS